MRVITTRTSASGRLRLMATLLLTSATIALLALLPTVSAQASTPTVTVPPAGEVEALLGQAPLGSLPTAQLTEALSQLEGFEGIEPAKLQEALTKLIDELSGKGATLEELLSGGEAATILDEKLHELLGPLASQLELLLGESLQTKVAEALDSSAVSEVLGKLLGGSPEPQALIAEVLQALSPERLQSVLGSILSGEPFTESTVEELAQQLGTTPEALAAQFGKTAEQLPATAMALTAPLVNGEKLAVLNGAGGTTLGLIKGAGETIGGTVGGSTGGTGGPGGSGTPGATVTVTTTTPAPAHSPATGVAAAKVGKLRIVSHKVKRANATIVVEVPSAGTISAGAKGVRSIKRETAKGERVTLHPKLTKAGTSSLRRHHRRLKVPVKVSFKQVGGPSSSAVVQLVYR